MKKMIVLMLLTVTLTICSGVAYAGYAAYDGSAYGFNLQYPSGWRVVEHRDRVQFIDYNHAMVDVFVAPVQPSSDPEGDVHRLANIVIDMLKKQYGNVEVIDQQTTTLGGAVARGYVYDVSPVVQGNTVRLRILQIMAIKGNKGFVFSYASSPEQYETYWPHALEIFNSFSFTE